MRGYLGITDVEWFQFLRALRPLPDEVNFWQPSAHGFRLPPGSPLFFKLKKDDGDAIAGFGIVARYETATPLLAWEAFGEKNGASTFERMEQRIAKYLSKQRKQAGPSHRIGCIMLSQPVFFPEADWVARPADWHHKRNSPAGVSYDLTQGEGRRIWEECREGAASVLAASDSASMGQNRFGVPQLVRPRLGQGTFRVAVTGAYGSACAVSHEHSLPVLEAAHIRPYSNDGPHGVPNGLLLRADIHRLFDAGYVGVTPDYRFVVSERLASDWDNGKAYYAMRGPIELPKHPEDMPSAEYLRWHCEFKLKLPAA